MKEAHKQRLREAQLRNISKLPNRECLYCKKKYKPTAFHQRFCCSECHYVYMYALVKKARNKFPKYTCQFCNKTIQLNFNPINNSNKFKNFKCPYCNEKRTF